MICTSLSMAHMKSRVSKNYNNCWGATNESFSFPPQCVSSGAGGAKQPLLSSCSSSPPSMRHLVICPYLIVLNSFTERRVNSSDFNSSQSDAGLEHRNCTCVHRCPLWKSLIWQIISGHTKGNNGRATNENWIPIKHRFPHRHTFIINSIFYIFVKNTALDIYTTLMTSKARKHLYWKKHEEIHNVQPAQVSRFSNTGEWNAVTAFFP